MYRSHFTKITRQFLVFHSINNKTKKENIYLVYWFILVPESFKCPSLHLVLAENEIFQLKCPKVVGKLAFCSKTLVEPIFTEEYKMMTKIVPQVK